MIHLVKMGFVDNYHDWRCHNTSLGESSSTVMKEQEQVQLHPYVSNRDQNEYVQMVHHAATSRFHDTYYNNFHNHEVYTEERPTVHIEEEPNPQTR